MKAIYFYDTKTKIFTSVDLIDDDEGLPANATDVQPIGEDGTGLYDPKWDGEKWVGCTADEYEDAHKDDPLPDGETPVGPSDVEQALTALSKQYADTQEAVKQLQEAITVIAMGGNE